MRDYGDKEEDEDSLYFCQQGAGFYSNCGDSQGRRTSVHWPNLLNGTFERNSLSISPSPHPVFLFGIMEEEGATMLQPRLL